MQIKILTPETVVFEGEVVSMILPGKSGEFHVMNQHAPIVSTLNAGKIRLYIAPNTIDKNHLKNLNREDESLYSFSVSGGVLEFNNNKGILLCE
ncbi:MAG: F0F1 ATP synthase subunit epsilon [Bergeyella sp.]|nr:F0F1 ATP synthase subunit epsilon [Bergeyella sp.]